MLIEYVASPIPASTTISDTTINTSISVNPESRIPIPESRRGSPITVFGPVKTLSVVFGKDVKHVLAAPRLRIRLVARRPHAPIGGMRQRVDRNTAQKSKLCARAVVGDCHAVNQHLKRRRIPFGGRRQIAG